MIIVSECVFFHLGVGALVRGILREPDDSNLIIIDTGYDYVYSVDVKSIEGELFFGPFLVFLHCRRVHLANKKWKSEFRKMVSGKGIHLSIKTINDIFTRRELWVLNKICNGYSNRQIAECSTLSEKTVSSYKRRVLHKLNFGSMTKFLAEYRSWVNLWEKYVKHKDFCVCAAPQEFSFGEYDSDMLFGNRDKNEDRYITHCF